MEPHGHRERRAYRLMVDVMVETADTSVAGLARVERKLRALCQMRDRMGLGKGATLAEVCLTLEPVPCL